MTQSLAKLPDSERGKCAVLARRRKLLEEVANALADHAIPAHVGARKNEFESAPYRWLHAMLRLANARHDREQLRRVLRAFFQIEGLRIDTDDVVTQAALESGDLLRGWIDIALERSGIEPETVEMLGVAQTQLVGRLE